VIVKILQQAMMLLVDHICQRSHSGGGEEGGGSHPSRWTPNARRILPCSPVADYPPPAREAGQPIPSGGREPVDERRSLVKRRQNRDHVCDSPREDTGETDDQQCARQSKALHQLEATPLSSSLHGLCSMHRSITNAPIDAGHPQSATLHACHERLPGQNREVIPATEPSGSDPGQTVRMDLESATDELYGVIPSEFTAARNARVAEARKAGLADVAASLKKLRKPSAGAWLANLLVRERSNEIESLIGLGDSLREPGSKRGGEEIRKVSKQRVDAASKLIRQAKSRASQLGHPASTSAVEELETTLDAAFADPQAAAQLRQGRLTVGLRYSGLGFIAPPDTGSPARTKGSGSARDSKSEAQRIAATRDLDKANHEAEQADAEMERARRAVKDAAAELTRLKSAEVQAVRRSKDAHARVTAAEKKLSKRR
jgi:hypothetical protein